MRNVAAALGIIAFVLAPATAHAIVLVECNYTWNAGGADYSTPGNWNNTGGPCAGGFPDGGTDNAIINSGANQPVFSSGTITPKNITINAANSVPVSLTINGGSFTCSAVSVAAPSSYSATFDISAGTFAPSSLSFDGSASASAYGYFDVDVSVGSGSGVLTIQSGMSDLDIMRDAELTVGVFTVNGDADFSLAASSGSSGSGVISATSYVQNGGTNGSVAAVSANAQIVTR